MGGVQTREHRLWSELVGQSFGLAPGFDREVEVHGNLRLEQVILNRYRNDRYRPPHLRPASISLLFSAPAGTQLTSATYTVTHPDLGGSLHFLQRTVRADFPNSAIYEVVLN